MLRGNLCFAPTCRRALGGLRAPLKKSPKIRRSVGCGCVYMCTLPRLCLYFLCGGLTLSGPFVLFLPYSCPLCVTPSLSAERDHCCTWPTSPTKPRLYLLLVRLSHGLCCTHSCLLLWYDDKALQCVLLSTVLQWCNRVSVPQPVALIDFSISILRIIVVPSNRDLQVGDLHYPVTGNYRSGFFEYRYVILPTRVIFSLRCPHFIGLHADTYKVVYA